MTQYSVPAKATFYRGIEMRSRHEAKWAAFFDAVGMVWEYEPSLDLGVWKPDFRLMVPCTGEVCTAEYHTILVEVKPWASKAEEWQQHPSTDFIRGNGIQEDGIGHFGLDWDNATCYIRHGNTSPTRSNLKNRLISFCDAYTNGEKDINKFCREQWGKAEEVVKEIRKQEERQQGDKPAPILHIDRAVDAHAIDIEDCDIYLDADTDVEPLVAFSQQFLQYFERDSTFTTEDVLDVVRSTVLAFDKDLRQHASPDTRLRLLDIMHMIEQRSTASLKGRRTVK